MLLLMLYFSLKITASPEASQLSGGLTNAQILNAEVANSLYQLSCGLNQVLATLEDAPSAAVVAIGQSVKNVTLVMETTLNLLLDAVMTSLENKMARIHTENFISSDSAVEDVDDQGDSSSSSYIKDIRNFIQRIQHDYFSMYECKDVLQESLKPVAARCLTLFVRHASLLHDISETGKMKLTNDMAQLELAVSPFCKRISDLGAAYKMLRAFRPLLFQSLDEIQSNPALGEALPYTVVLHFLFSKAPLDLRPPHIVAGWTLSEYSSWLDSHQGENEILRHSLATTDASKDSLATDASSDNDEVPAPPTSSIYVCQGCSVLKKKLLNSRKAMWRLRKKMKENKLAADISNDDAEHEEEDYYDEACMDDTEDINMEDMDYHELETSALSTDDENDEDVDDTDDDKEFDESKNNIILRHSLATTDASKDSLATDASSDNDEVPAPPTSSIYVCQGCSVLKKKLLNSRKAMWRLRKKMKENKLAADISNDDAEHEEEDYYDEACMDDTEDINMEDMDYHELETSALSTDDENDEDVDDTDDDKEFDESKNNIVW
eukprot:gene2114-17695_t